MRPFLEAIRRLWRRWQWARARRHLMRAVGVPSRRELKRRLGRADRLFRRGGWGEG